MITQSYKKKTSNSTNNCITQQINALPTQHAEGGEAKNQLHQQRKRKKQKQDHAAIKTHANTETKIMNKPQQTGWHAERWRNYMNKR